MSGFDGKAEHRNREATERRGYDELRQSGVTHERARSASREASEMAHRQLDKKHSDSGK